MKKIFLSILVLIGAVALMACGNKADKMMEELTSINNVYAISAVSGVEETINQVNEEVIVEDETNNQPKEELSETNNLDSLLGLLNDDLFKVVELTSDNDEYTNLLEINLNKETYLFYFNETLLDREEDDDEIEEEYLIKGIVLFNDLEFNVLGKKEVEIEDNEEEFEIELKISLDTDNYTIIKYERETEGNELEKEFKLKTYENGKLINEIKFDFELEDDQLEIDAEIRINNKLIKYEVKYNTNNDKGLVLYEIIENGQKTSGRLNVSVIIDGENVTYIYE